MRRPPQPPLAPISRARGETSTPVTALVAVAHEPLEQRARPAAEIEHAPRARGLQHRLDRPEPLIAQRHALLERLLAALSIVELASSGL